MRNRESSDAEGLRLIARSGPGGRRRYGLRLGLWILTLAVIVVACSRTPREDLPSEAFEPDRPEQESWGTVYRLQEDGRPRLEIHAGYMAQHETEDSTYTLLTPGSSADRVRMFWYDSTGTKSGTIDSDKIYFFESEQRLVAEGHVVATTADSTRLETERLHWNREEERLRAPGFARIITPTERIQGYELTADEKLDDYSLARVTGQVRIEEGSDP